MNCKKCGKEIDKKAVICPGCGCKIKKPIFKKWWFWAIVIIVVVVAATSSGSDEQAPVNNTVSSEPKTTQEITYEAVDLQTMFDELDGNAMKAENNYKGKYVQIECKISNFDSKGAYISVEPKHADERNLTTAMCYIKDDAQKEFLIEKNVGDVITIKGKIKSVGEIMGYSVDIAEVF